MSNVAYFLESNEDYIHKISKQFEDKISIKIQDTLSPNIKESNLITEKGASTPKTALGMENTIRKKEIDILNRKKSLYFKSIATKLIISKTQESLLNKKHEKILISKNAWEALNKLADIIPNPFKKIVGNIEIQPHLWKEMLLRGNIDLKEELIASQTKNIGGIAPPKLKRNYTGIGEALSGSKEFCGLQLPMNNLTPIEKLTLIKYIRPDALEYVAKTMISTVRHSAFYYISKQNLETFARVSNCQKPNILFYNVKKWNPAELIELTSIRNNIRLMKICLGVSKINEILDMISTAAGSGSWILLENLHLVKRNKIKDIIKKISYEMEWNQHDIKFRVWFTYQISNKKFSECNFKKNQKGI